MVCIVFCDRHEEAVTLHCAHKWADVPWAHMCESVKVLREHDEADEGGEKGLRERTEWKHN